MMTFTPAASAPRITSRVRSGVRWAERTRSSLPTPSSSRTTLASRITGRSESLPMRIRTGFASAILASSRPGAAGQPLVDLAVLLRGPGDHLCGEMRRGRLLVPLERVQVVAHVLLVEGGLALPRLVLRLRPEPRGVGREDLVGEHGRSLLRVLGRRIGRDAPLELRVADDDSLPERVRGRLPVDVDRLLAELRRAGLAHHPLHLL